MPEELHDDGNALGMLRHEHDAIRALLGTVYERDADFAQQALLRVIEELKIHNSMERRYFFPLCEANSAIVTADRLQLGSGENMALEELTARIEYMDVTDENFLPVFEQLIHTFQRHCFAVEENMMVALEGGDWQMHNHLVECAVQMRSLRDEMLATLRRPREDEQAAFKTIQHRRAQEMGRGVYAPRDVVPEEQAKEESANDLSITTDGDIVNMGGKVEMDNQEGSAGR